MTLPVCPQCRPHRPHMQHSHILPHMSENALWRIRVFHAPAPMFAPSFGPHFPPHISECMLAIFLVFLCAPDRPRGTRSLRRWALPSVGAGMARELYAWSGCRRRTGSHERSSRSSDAQSRPFRPELVLSGQTHPSKRFPRSGGSNLPTGKKVGTHRSVR